MEKNTSKSASFYGSHIDGIVCEKQIGLGLKRTLKKGYPKEILKSFKMSSDFNFPVTSWFLGKVHVKPCFNTQCPPSSNFHTFLHTYEDFHCALEAERFANILLTFCSQIIVDFSTLGGLVNLKNYFLSQLLLLLIILKLLQTWQESTVLPTKFCKVFLWTWWHL